MRVKQAGKKMMLTVKKKKVWGGAEVDADQESVGSLSEEMDSPRSVVPKTKTGINGVGLKYLHSQIARIRDEDSHIGEDINAQVILNLWGADKQEIASLMLLSRPLFLPASPLSGKTTTKSREN